MLDFNYYIVTSYVFHKNLSYPMITTCAKVDGKFFIIDDLEKYLSNGHDGISDKEIIPSDFKCVFDNHFKI